MYCINCGAQVNDGDVFCANCGTQVKHAIDEIETKEAESNNEQRKLKSSKTPVEILKLIGSIVAFILVLSILCYAAFTTIVEMKEKKDYGTLSAEDIDFSSDATDMSTLEYVYVGDVLDYMTSDIINENVEIEGYAVFASMGMDGSEGHTMAVVIRDEDWNGTIALHNIDDYDIESYGLEDEDYCSVKGYIYYDEYDSLVIDVHSIEIL